MGAPPEVVVHRDEPLLAAGIAARLVTRIVDAQAAKGSASVVLTGGGIGVAALVALRASPAVDAIDWARLDVWWGDERYVPHDSPDRNERQAREALLDHVPVDDARVFPMAPSDGPGAETPEAAADLYAQLLASRTAPEVRGPVPRFDVLMLGMGPEGHTASMFPESPAVRDTRPVVAVHGCPKPPPTRITMTLPTICAATEAWMLVSGESKAEATRLALSGAGPVQIPAAGVSGRVRTLWLLDAAAAGQLPPGLNRLASP
ncbi:MAG: 6-phosphogluconolactonase [Frankiaceae bacterium]